jgi:hypothetical protein
MREALFLSGGCGYFCPVGGYLPTYLPTYLHTYIQYNTYMDACMRWDGMGWDGMGWEGRGTVAAAIANGGLGFEAFVVMIMEVMVVVVAMMMFNGG